MNLGIDVGTISVKVVCVDDEGNTVHTAGPTRHEGRSAQALATLLRELPEDIKAGVAAAAVTGAGRTWAAEALRTEAVNSLRTLSRAFAALHPEVRTVIEIGGHHSQLIIMSKLRESDEPVAVDASRSSMCAAGTGSFLDQQALRLGFKPEELGAQAMKSEKPANVSGRCSVFANTDLIHLQQMGTPDTDMLAGLCYAMVRTFRSSVAKGRKIEKPVALCGGVALNECVRRAVEEVFELSEGEFVLPERPEFMAALGAAMVAMESARAGHSKGIDLAGIGRLEAASRSSTVARRLSRLGRPTHPAGKERKVHPLPDGTGTSGYLGIDIGSISTKAAVVDEEGKVVARRYFWTSGRPIESVRRAMKEIGGEMAGRVEIKGVGTTGSGRYLVGDFVGADVVKNEITAQARAAAVHDPEADTVFEIGGQDSKFIVIRDGTVVDFEMNKVCAAGTGAFLNEQAEQMGIDIEEEFSALSFASKEPLDCGERCTVFMETDVSNYLASGASREDIAAGLAHSIAKNYLSKVADRAKIGNNILFQGAVAFNDAVVAALEKETGKTVRVTPDNEITGCIGVALIARDARVGKSSFRGFGEIAECGYRQEVFTCGHCPNHCDVKKVTVEGLEPRFYGDRCDRYQTERRKESEVPDYFKERERHLLHDYVPEPVSGPLVGIPRTLPFFDTMPYWRTFLRELGARTILSDRTTRDYLDKAADFVTTDTCLPIKAAHGHVLNLLQKKPDYIFLPVLIDRKRPRDESAMRYNCPFVQVWGHVVQAGIDPLDYGVKVLQPVVFNELGERLMGIELGGVADALGASSADVKRARRAAEEAQEDFVRRMRERGREILADLPGSRGVVIAGRPYNTCDPVLSLDLPKKLRKMGVLPIPADFLPLEQVDVLSAWPNMYWNYGRAILAAATIVGESDQLDMIYVTNFRCGPDSFITKYVNEALKGKPYLLLEFDDHSADAGVLTRVEAFLDSRRARAKSAYTASARRPYKQPPLGTTVYMPHMGDFMYGIAAAGRGYDVDLRVIPTDRTSLDLGLGYTSGKECLPYILCVGNIVKTVRSPDFNPDGSAFFMASGAGPCRFGQYEFGLQRVLDELGLPDVQIISLQQNKEVFRQLPSYGFGRHAYLGFAGAAEIERLSRQIRPYEAEPGTADRVYKESLDDFCRALEDRNKPYEALRRAAERFRSVKTVEADKPLVCVVGEGYVRSQPFANADICRKIEALGGEATVPTFVEYVHHLNHCMKILSGERHGVLKRFGLGFTRWLMKRIDGRINDALRPAFPHFDVPHIERLWENAIRARFVPFFGDASLAVGLAVEMAERGADGVANVMPFTCMPGSIARSQIRRAAGLMGGVPVIDIEFDGRGEEFLQEEVEMFMEQVKERHKAGASRRSPRLGEPADIDPALRAIMRL